MKPAPAPLCRDPIHDGAADPTIIWNHLESSWWILYTNRRANVDGRGLGWVHGTQIGIASSVDGGQSWLYRGTVNGLEFEKGINTFWAPEVIFDAGTYHMYVSYITGIPHDWSGARHIIHYTSNNLWDWHQESILALSSDRVIDACVHSLPSGGWRMWYKDEAIDSHIVAADSTDLYHWSVTGAVLTQQAQEGPNVFYWHERYWLIADSWAGMDAYWSHDLERWTYSGKLLSVPGTRADDGWIGNHADVLVHDQHAYIFYFTHPQRGQTIESTMTEVEPYTHRRTSLQVAMLAVNGDTLVCDRDAPFDFNLTAPSYP